MKPLACLLMLLCASLGGCAAPSGMVPVSVACVGPVPARPVTTFGSGGYPGDKAAAQAALVDAMAWEAYATRLEVIIAGCPST